MKPTRKTDDEIQAAVTLAITGAVSFIESVVKPGRVKAQRYFDGEVDIGSEDGRSSVVATKARDVVRAIKPSLMRVFLQSEKPVEFVPRGPDDVPAAEQATAFINWKFQESNGYRILNSAFHDALVKRAGIVKVFWDESEKVETESYSGLTDDEFVKIMMDDDIEAIEHSEEEEDLDGQIFKLHDLTIERKTTDGTIRLESVPPEEFFVDSQARAIDDCVVCGHSTPVTVSDLVAMGVDFSEASELDGYEQSQEDLDRLGGAESGQIADPAMRIVLATEAFMSIDIDGKGIARRYKFLCGGSKYKILKREPCNDAPFAIFEVDPEPHAFFGRSLVDLVINDQDAATSMLRGLLDNVSLSNNPGTEVLDGQVNMDDLLNNEIGRIVRVKQIGATREVTVPFMAGATLPALQYFDELIEQKTGVTRASMGLNPDAMQSTTAAAVNATVQGASGQAEIIARNLAEGGMKRLFRLMLKLMNQHPSVETMMRLNGQFVPVDPSSWNVSMDMTANVGIGTGRHEERAMALREVFQTQSTIWQGFGPGNGFVSMTNMRNTLADILAHSGLMNADRYYQPMDDGREKELLAAQAEAAANQPPQPDQNAAYLEAEKIKSQVKMQEIQAKGALDAERAIMADDLARDQMAQDALFKAVELLGNYGIQVDTAQLQAQQAATR